MRLVDLVAAVPGARLVRGAAAREVGRVSDRDDRVAAGDVFVAIRGSRVDGHDRLASLGHAGALVVEREVAVPDGPAVIRVDDTRRALAPLCAASLGHPARSLPVVGVTGTNGKTSITFLLAAIARAAGGKPGIVGTTGSFVGDRRLETEHTSPTAPVLQSVLAEMRDENCTLCAMEASSIGLAAYRCDAIPFRAAVFTNLTRDHLDWHGTMEAYAAAKARLFSELLHGTAVLNADDAAHVQMRPSNHLVWTYSIAGAADIRATVRRHDWSGMSAEVETPAGRAALDLQLVGLHNLQNALGALGAALAVGLPLSAAVAGLAASPGAPGRLERVATDRGFAVFVDYAHTDDALDRVLETLRALGPRRILTVFGCGGDRDRGKRPLMGAAAARGSDLVIVTSDNPRSESPTAILADIVPGLGAAPHHVVADRAAAIALAVSLAGAGDVVLIAGKGHEAWQEIAGVKHPFDDRVVAREALR